MENARLSLLTVAVALMVSPAHAQKGKGKPGGGEDTTNLLQVTFSNRGGDRVIDDGDPYLDSRAGGDVEAFLYPSGNVTLRLEGSLQERELSLDLSAPLGDPFPHSTSFSVGIRELNNSHLRPSEDTEEQACDEAGSQGDRDLKNRGLLCMKPGTSRVSAVAIWWDGDLFGSPNQRFRLRWRDDSDDPSSGENNVVVTRCGGATDPGACAAAPSGLPAWVFSTTPPAPEAGIPDVGSIASVTSATIKGKPESTDYGLFDVSFEFLAVCVQSCPASPW